MALEEQVEKKLRGGDTGTDIGYWESLLQQLKAHMARVSPLPQSSPFILCSWSILLVLCPFLLPCPLLSPSIPPPLSSSPSLPPPLPFLLPVHSYPVHSSSPFTPPIHILGKAARQAPGHAEEETISAKTGGNVELIDHLVYVISWFYKCFRKGKVSPWVIIINWRVVIR